jgi:hypothetical protein
VKCEKTLKNQTTRAVPLASVSLKPAPLRLNSKVKSMRNNLSWCLAIGLAFVVLEGASFADVITFETTPAGGIPIDNANLAAPYPLIGGGNVTFFFDNNGNYVFNSGIDTLPVFEAYGADINDGFANGLTGISDTANGGLAGQLGSFFLRQLQPGGPPPPFIVDYNTSQVITALSGEIWDIDGSVGNTEGWLVEALDSSNSLLTSQLSPVGNSTALDGLPWTFSFSSLPTGFDKLRITFAGSKTTGLGLAFNNFDPTNAAIPEPNTFVLFFVSATSLIAWRSRH